MKPPAERNRSDFLLNLIVFEKAVLGFLALSLSAGVLSLVNKDLEILATQLAAELNLEADNRFLMFVTDRLIHIRKPTLIGVSVIGFFYAGLNFVEAWGLALRYRWAEYLTVVATAIFIPFEIYSLIERLTFFRVVALAVNILIVLFLIRHKELFPKKADRPPDH